MIFDNHIMRWLKLPNVSSFTFRWSPKLCYGYYAARHLEVGPSSPLYLAIKRHYEARPQNLWWYVNLPITDGGKSKIVRGHVMNRVKHAVRVALKNRGFDGEGSRIRDNGPGLKGSVTFYIQKPCFDRKPADLMQDVEKAVDFFVRELTEKEYKSPRSLPVSQRQVDGAKRRPEKEYQRPRPLPVSTSQVDGVKRRPIIRYSHSRANRLRRGLDENRTGS